MSFAKIQALSTYLPERVLSNAEIERKFPGFSAAKIFQKVGIDSRHVAADHETALDMGESACLSLFTRIDPNKIDFVLFCTESPDHKLPPNACILQKRLGLRDSIGALDYNLGCSGFIYGLAMAKGLIAAGVASEVLLVTAETYSKYINPCDRANLTIFGDGAAATLVSSSEVPGIGDFVLGTDGSGMENLIVRNGGARVPFSPGAGESEYTSGSCQGANDLYMNGPEIFNYTIATVPGLVERVLEKNGLQISDISLVVFHQANRYILDFLRKLTGIPEEKFYVAMEDTGNTVSASIPIALEKALTEGRVAASRKVLIVGFGVGYSSGATVISL